MKKLKNKIIHFIKKIISDPINYSRNIGVKIGVECKLNGIPNWGSEPYLIKIGNRTEISFDVAFITHDGATWTFRNQEKYKNVIKFGLIKIGDECFIGARSIIMPGVIIGDRCIVAAGSVVTKNIPSGEVWGGVPAKYISTTKEYADKCLRNTPEYNIDNFNCNKKEELLRLYSPDVNDDSKPKEHI